MAVVPGRTLRGAFAMAVAKPSMSPAEPSRVQGSSKAWASRPDHSSTQTRLPPQGPSTRPATTSGSRNAAAQPSTISPNSSKPTLAEPSSASTRARSTASIAVMWRRGRRLARVSRGTAMSEAAGRALRLLGRRAMPRRLLGELVTMRPALFADPAAAAVRRGGGTRLSRFAGVSIGAHVAAALLVLLWRLPMPRQAEVPATIEVLFGDNADRAGSPGSFILGRAGEAAAHAGRRTDRRTGCRRDRD